MGCKNSTAIARAVESDHLGGSETGSSAGLEDLLNTVGLQWVSSISKSEQPPGTGGESSELVGLVVKTPPTRSASFGVRSWPAGPSGRGNRVLIFDWDDTLFPLSWFRTAEAAVRAEEPGADVLRNLSHESDAIFAEIAREVRKILTVAKELTQVMICTNAVRPWVHSANARFLKMPESALEAVEVAYAREYLLEKDRTKEPDVLPMVAKLRAMEHAIKERSNTQGRVWPHIVCIGDSSAEHTAIRFAMNRLPKKDGERFCLKNIKLVEEPSLEKMLGQLRLVSLWLPKIIALEQSVYIDLEGHLEKLLAFHERLKPDEAGSPDWSTEMETMQ